MKESKEKLNRAKTTPDHYRVTTRSASTGRGRPGSGVKGQEKSKTPVRLGTERSKAPFKGYPAKHTLGPGTTVPLIFIPLINIHLLDVRFGRKVLLQANCIALLLHCVC